MPTRLQASAKTAVRKATRRMGYDLVPTAGGLPALQQAILRATTPVAIDIGANVGQYAERLRDLGFAGQIISFEPGAQAYELLAEKAKKQSHWHVRRRALSDQSGVAMLQVAANSVSSSLLPVAEEHVLAEPRSRTVSQEEVQVVTLDSEMQDELGRPFWLKLDVQGHELAVLRGAEQTLSDTYAVQAEISFGDLYHGQADWLELCAFLIERGFRLRYLEPGFEDRKTGYMLQADVLFLRA